MEMMIKGYLAILTLLSVMTAIPFILSVVSRAWTSKIYQILLTIVFVLSELYLLFMLLFAVLTFFIYSIPATLITAVAYFGLKKHSKIRTILEESRNHFLTVGIKSLMAAVGLMWVRQVFLPQGLNSLP